MAETATPPGTQNCSELISRTMFHHELHSELHFISRCSSSLCSGYGIAESLLRGITNTIYLVMFVAYSVPSSSIIELFKIMQII